MAAARPSRAVAGVPARRTSLRTTYSASAASAVDTRPSSKVHRVIRTTMPWSPSPM